MAPVLIDRVERDGHVLGVAHTTREAGDLCVDAAPDELAARRVAVAAAIGDADRPWVWLRQVHGPRVVTVTSDESADLETVVGAEADALVTAVPGLLLAVHTADCAPVALLGAGGVVGIAHAGWRGIEAGVLEATVAAMRAAGAGSVEARLGPCIHAECYEFGVEELDRLTAQLGPAVRGITATGAPALDVPAAVRSVLDGLGVPLVEDRDGCTACSTAYWSHRARADVGRQANLVWIEP